MAVAFAPGRANLIGEHTDYNDGLALPFAIAGGVRVRTIPRSSPGFLARAVDLGEEDEFGLPPAPAEGWRAFVRGTVAELGSEEPAEIEIEGDIAQGAGLSSSAALGVALALALGSERDPVAVARLCSRVENAWVGAQTGLLDQLASLLGREGCAVRIDFRTLETEQVPLALGDWRLVVVDSGETHDLAASGYNERRAECERARLELGLESLRDATPDDAARLPDPLDRRILHVIEENARVEAAVRALRDEDLARLGPLLDASHASLRDLYDASTPAVERTVDALRGAGATGARMMGGGFGGSVLALLPPEAAVPAGALAVSPGPGAHLLG